MAKRHWRATALISVVLLAPLPVVAQPAPAPDRWAFSVMPYLWLPSVQADLNYGPPPLGGGSPSVSVDASDILDNLNFGFMLTGDARRGRWLVATDVMYVHAGSEESSVRSVTLNPGTGPINISTASRAQDTESSLRTWVWSLAGGYAIVQEARASVDLLAGFRYLYLSTSTDWRFTTTVTGTGPLGNTATFARSGRVEDSESIWAGIVGARGRAMLGASNWFVNGYVDVGGGSSAFTWQGLAGIGYAFKWGDIVLDYRYLYYSQGDDKLIDDMSLGGIALGANFRF